MATLQVADPWGGSFMMESLTDEAYHAALAMINEVTIASLTAKLVAIFLEHPIPFCVLT